ncbi:Swt1 family HEPN domain-containing protein [Propionimicrobium sp. PCR01-08-3]|uniref:DUF3320 domain-containing protein n=1 Tax=Propionimicrobium sp. PCR01-08-3 TaxID=3052086 RepID=UPI00255CD635|nr:Swt1 family HEPN domain-containing protein [Propionimicrobium sp. PCR01-08-3]WIY82950.1 Swt1 family HEPN domain-containing protein [Propionimicrobium sp. PCR01-08-3]
MTTESNPNHSVQTAFTLLSGRLDPIIAKRLREELGGLPWTAVLEQLDHVRGYNPKTYSSSDLQAQLRMLTEKLGGLGYPFERDSNRTVSTLGSELRIMRNRWAHNDEFTALDAWRAYDFSARLLHCFDDHAGLVQLEDPRLEALAAAAAAEGVATTTVLDKAEVDDADVEEPLEDTEGAGEEELVSPDPSMMVRSDSAATPLIGNGRAEFSPWEIVKVGDKSVLDALPKKAAKEKVRAAAIEITEFEGPIHIERLANLVAQSFGMHRVAPKRMDKITYQIRQTDLVIDRDKFVWPSAIDRGTWTEFRPNDSTCERSFLLISPVEISNAAKFLRATRPDIGQVELESAALQTFGRKRRTKQLMAHLKRGLDL